MSRHAAIIVAAVAACAGLGAAWFSRAHEAPPIANATAPLDDESPAASSARVVEALATTVARRPHASTLEAARRVREAGSLRGADRDGEVTLGTDGRLRPDRALRRLFDWYLSTIGELDVAAIRALMQSDLSIEFGISVASQVLAEFDRYVGYLDAEKSLPRQATPLDRLTAMHVLRRQRFGEEMAEAYFGEEERYAEATLARLDAARAVSEGERGATAHAADPLAREAETADVIAEQDAQFEQLDIDADTRHEERAALWGRDAALRLAALEQQRAEWSRRIHAYQREAEPIRRDARLDAATRERSLAALRARNFSEAERLRIEALEAIGQLPASG